MRSRLQCLSVMWSLTLTLLIGPYLSPVFAESDRSYKAVREWLEKYRDAKPDFKPGEHLTIKDIERIKPFLPQPAWEFYFFDDMDMEIAETGKYPPPADWGKHITKDYYLDEYGAFFGFNGAGWPFPEIKADDPYAALKVYWNSYWRPGMVTSLCQWWLGDVASTANSIASLNSSPPRPSMPRAIVVSWKDM